MNGERRAAVIARLMEDPDDPVNRGIAADWFEENGELELAKAIRENKELVRLTPVQEITLPVLLTDSDWAQVFADENDGNVSKNTDACPPGSDVDTAPPSRTDVVEIIAAVNGENDGQDWEGVFRLADGRYLLASGGCDYTGWD